jgi:hypothetical protein
MIAGPALLDAVSLHYDNIVQKISRVDLLMWRLNAKSYHEQFQARYLLWIASCPDVEEIYKNTLIL